MQQVFKVYAREGYSENESLCAKYVQIAAQLGNHYGVLLPEISYVRMGHEESPFEEIFFVNKMVLRYDPNGIINTHKENTETIDRYKRSVQDGFNYFAEY